jgi:hypothetical protein
MRLSVFRGGFDLEAAEQVAGASLPILAGLVDKSLVRLNADGRYDLHELLRQYVAEKLTQAGEVAVTAQRHLDYFAALAEQAEAHQYGPEQRTWLDCLDVELDNIRAALAWSLDNGSAEGGLRMASAMREFWEYHGHLLEGFAWSKRLLAVAHDISPSLRVKALYRAGELAPLDQDGFAVCTEAVNLARQIGDPRHLAWALSVCAYFSQPLRRGFPIATIPSMDESLGLFRQIDDPYGLSHALRRRAFIAFCVQDHAYARTLAEEALTGARSVGDRHAMAWSLTILGVLSAEGHDPNQTAALFEESVTLFRELDDRVGIRSPLAFLGRLEQLAGHPIRARSL